MIKPRTFVQKILTNFFPVPEFLLMPSVGLTITDNSIRFVELIYKNGKFTIGTFGEQKIPADIVEEGYIKNKSELTKILTELRKKYKLHYIRASLPDEKAYLFDIKIPKMDEGDIRGALRFKIEENVPISINDAVFDFHYINEPKPADEQFDLGVTVIHSKVVSSYMSVFYDAGLVPLKLRTESQAIAHAIIKDQDETTSIVMSLEETKIIFAIISKGLVQFSSTLDRGQEAIEVSAVLSEIKKMVNYWDSHGVGDVSVHKIIINGPETAKDIQIELSKSLSIPIEFSNVWINILSLDTTVPPIERSQAYNYATALGLALPYD